MQNIASCSAAIISNVHPIVSRLPSGKIIKCQRARSCARDRAETLVPLKTHGKRRSRRDYERDGFARTPVPPRSIKGGNSRGAVHDERRCRTRSGIAAGICCHQRVPSSVLRMKAIEREVLRGPTRDGNSVVYPLKR